MARTWYPSLPIGGTITGAATINGSTQTELAVRANIDHRDRGTQSLIEGTAAIGLSGGKRFTVSAVASPVSLEEVGLFFPSAGLQGTAAGPVQLTGTLSALAVNADLRLPDGGQFTTTGTLDLASADKGYDLTSSLVTLNLRTIDSKAPVTSLTAHASVRGRGTAPATMTATLAADLSASRWVGTGPRDSIALDTVSIRATVGGGRATISKLYAFGAHTSATISGTLGLTKEQTGTITYAIATDSLGAFNRLIPRDTTRAKIAQVPPRPGVVARAFRRARADSTRVAKATEVERAVNGRPGPQLAVTLPKAVPNDTLAGKASAKGTVSGSIEDFDLRGTASGENVIARGNFVHRFRGDYAWTHVRTPQAALTASISADTVSAMGFFFDSLSARGTYSPTGGHAEVSVNQSDNRRYSAAGDYVLRPDRKELKLGTLDFRFDTTAWSMTHPSSIQWGGPGVQVNDLELRNHTDGRIHANGLLPTEGAADFTLTVEQFPIANLVDILQTDIDLAGLATVDASMSGTLSAPAFRATFGLKQGTYNGVTVPVLDGRVAYADRALVTHVDALRKNGTSMTTIDGHIPINLAFTDVTGSRILADPMSVDLVADSLLLELIPQFTDVVTDLHGRAHGTMAARGTLNHPLLSGSLALDDGSVTVAATGAKLQDAAAAIHLAADTVYVDSIAARTKRGRAVGTLAVRGRLIMGDWREPAFDLRVAASDAELLNNTYGKARVDAALTLTGPFRSASLRGAATIVQGVIYAPEPGSIHALVGAGDPSLYKVLDTTSGAARDLFPSPSPLLSNLRINIALSVKHDTWVRNREANIEVYTDDPLSVRQEGQSFYLTGAIATDRGEYEALSKRFQIKRGSALFIGTPDLDPTLQITGEYEVEVAGRSVAIRVIVGGTLHHPKLSLESDAQPPKTQSELLSLLAFGQASTTLIASNSSSIPGSPASSDLVGVGAEAAVQRLAGVALGVAVQQVEMQAGRAFGTDVFDITPGDVPLFNGSGPRDFFTQTKIEAGKYVNPRTFVSVQEQAGLPGLSVDHRTANGWQFYVSTSPRILLSEPTLSDQPHRTLQSYGGFVIREWRF